MKFRTNLPKPFRTCEIRQCKVDGKQRVQCLGQAKVLSLYGFTPDLIEVVMGRPPSSLSVHEGSLDGEDLWLWCPDCGKQVLEGMTSPVPTSEDVCAFCNDHFIPWGNIRHGCTLVKRGRVSKFLCVSHTNYILKKIAESGEV